MIGNSQNLEDLEDKLEGYLSANRHMEHYHSLKSVILKLAINACADMDQELRLTLEKALKLWTNNSSFGEISDISIEESRKKLDRAIKEAGVDSKQSWLARLNYTALNDMVEDDDTLMTLIFEYSSTNELDVCELSSVLIDQLPGFSV